MTQIRLEIATGNGNTATASAYPTPLVAWEPMLFLAGGQLFANYNGYTAGRLAGDFDSIINNLREAPYLFASLTAVQQGYRFPMLDYFTRLRDACREHPNCTVYVGGLYPFASL
jgi:hypothetical protein